MWRIFRSELLKLRKSHISLLVFVSPLLASLLALLESVQEEAFPWHQLLATMALLHGLLFLPLLAGVFAAFICRYEHAGGGWKQIFVLPVSRTGVYVVKFGLIMGLLLACQLLFLGGLLGVGMLKGIEAPVPWDMLGRSLLGGWVACAPLAALQLGVSTAWSSFAAPLALNVIFTLPNILVINSEKFGPWYPWGQPVLAMLSGAQDGFGAFLVPPETLLIVIAGGFALFFAGGLLYFRRKAM
ncbi:membrane protein [Paenibacillus sp. 32O-W]|uniref:ABC transporter permease n=1 Tax=Paenibacillus sp. 32O-W TaxID=1695218 RepID=UPI000722CA20|nr:ABC transporter permease [Paenibacillus sp. 32O-W]ALS25920.1 membrane protein [Paenibacillus sp. 32O-W]